GQSAELAAARRAFAEVAGNRSRRARPVCDPGAMTLPTEPVVVPDLVRELAGDGRLTLAWRNELGGLTFRAEPSGPDEPATPAKWSPRTDRALTEWVDLVKEAARVEWAERYTRVPHA